MEFGWSLELDVTHYDAINSFQNDYCYIVLFGQVLQNTDGDTGN